MTVSSRRVVARYLEAKGTGASLIPEFTKAKEKLVEGSSEAMLAFMDRVLPQMSTELVAWLKSDGPKYARELMTSYLVGMVTEKNLHDGIKGSKDLKVVTDDLLHGPLSVTPYGATKPMENYAEAFAHYVLGMDMPQELADILASEK